MIYLCVTHDLVACSFCKILSSSSHNIIIPCQFPSTIDVTISLHFSSLRALPMGTPASHRAPAATGPKLTNWWQVPFRPSLLSACNASSPFLREISLTVFAGNYSFFHSNQVIIVEAAHHGRPLFYLFPLVWITAWDIWPKPGQTWHSTLLAWVGGNWSRNGHRILVKPIWVLLWHF